VLDAMEADAISQAGDAMKAALQQPQIQPYHGQP
jgi:hypothetical protein